MNASYTGTLRHAPKATNSTTSANSVRLPSSDDSEASAAALSVVSSAIKPPSTSATGSR